MYGLTLINQNMINEKAKTRKDGCYQFRGVAYRIRGGKVTHFCSGGEVYQQAYGFNALIGTCPISTEEAKRFLKLQKDQ